MKAPNAKLFGAYFIIMIYILLLIPIRNDAKTRTIKPVHINARILAGTHFHSPRYNPQRVAKTIVKVMRIPHATNENSPICDFPIPKNT